jgi:amino acid adenylation domain-containing protein
LDIAELVRDLTEQGVQLWFEGEWLRFRAVEGTASEEQTSRIAANSVDILAYLRARAAAQVKTCELSYGQQAIWFIHQHAPESSVHNVSFVVRVHSKVNVEALKAAVQALVDRHEILRTGYGFVDGVMCQKIVGLGTDVFEVKYISPKTNEELDAIVNAEHRRPFDLARGSVFRVSLLARNDADHVLLVTPHHIAIDGWSGVILIHELFKLYEGAAGGRAADLSKPSLDYSDYCAWQSAMLAGPEGDRLWAYWQRAIAAPRTPLNLPTDRPRPATRTYEGASVRFLLEPAITERTKQLARREATTPFVILLACFHTLLFRLTGAEDIIVGTPALARKKSQFLRILGDFINPLPLRAFLAAGMKFSELVRQLHQTVREGIDAQEFPFSLMVQRLQPERDPSRSPLFDCFFVLQRFHKHREIEQLLYADEDGDVVELGGLQLSAYPFNQQEGQFDLTLQIVERAGAFRATLKYSTDLFEEPTVRKFAADYVSLVDMVTSDPEFVIGSARLVGSDAASISQPISALLDRLRSSDVRLTLDGDRLRISAPKGAIDEELKALLTARRDEIIAALQSASPRQDHSNSVGIRAVSRTGTLPVSAAQRLFWFLDQLEPGRSHYNIGNGVRIRGPLNFEFLQSAINQLFARHESLRTRIGQRDGSPWVEILEPSESALEVADLTDTPLEARETEAHRVAAAWMPKPFDLARGPLARTLVIRLAPDDHVLVISVHHIVADGWSVAIAFKEICEFYEAGASGRIPKLPDLPIQYVDYANWEHEQLRSGHLAGHIAYWRKQLEGAPALLQLPTDRPRPAVQSFRGGRIMQYIEASTVDGLKARSRDRSATLFMILLTAWQVLLHRYSGQDDIVVGSPVANRDLPVFEGVMGCLVNNIVLRGRLGGNPRFVDLLEQAKQTTLSAFDHRLLPFDLLVEGLNPERSTSHAPIFQVLFTLLSYPMQWETPAGLSFKMVDSYTNAARFDITLELAFVEVGEHENQLGALCEYSTDLFDETTIVRLLEHFRRVLVAAAADPFFRIDDLSLLTPEDEQLILEDWNATDFEHDRGCCVHQMLEFTARAMPDAPAVTAEEVTLSYGEFDGMANRLAHLLRERGVGPGDLVAVCLDRTVDVPVALAAIWKAGAAYVPLDPTHPPKRLQYIVKDAGVSCAITLGRYAHLVKEAGVTLVLLDELPTDLADPSAEPPDVRVQPDDLAYVIYTSGSTGQPKGVEVAHRNVVSFLDAMRREPGLTSTDVILAVTTWSFDIAGLELWLPLSTGAHVVIAAQADVLDGQRLAASIDAHRISVLQATPAVWRLLLESGWAGNRNLKALCGGESMPRDLAGALIEKVGELWNMYGPTETTIWSTVSRVRDITGTITIGHPIANTQVFVLDRNSLLAPIGVTGELCIAGEGVARGYRNRPEMTAEKFVTIILPNGCPKRVYRTGDLARFRNDGQLEYIGRRDNQVKVRGHRIELGEVEAALAKQPGVSECVVEAREYSPGDQRLVGYVTKAIDASFDHQAARANLRATLPEYMVPDVFVVLPTLPLTQNGKIDRKSLPLPKSEVRLDDAADAVMSPMQRRVADLWREVLRIDRVGLNDNFFDVGGHSLLLTKLHAGLAREFDTDMTLVELFQRTTVALQAERLASGSSADAVLKQAQARAVRQVHG